MQDPAIASVVWFQDYYARCMISHLGAIEILQRPGETVYVPAGWPHIVLNLEASVAITQNYSTEYPTMKRLIQAVEHEEPEIAKVWLKKLVSTRPDLCGHEDGMCAS